MKRIKLKPAGIIDSQRSILEAATGSQVIVGDSESGCAHICHGCDAVLMSGIDEGSVRGFLLQCPGCCLVSISG